MASKSYVGTSLGCKIKTGASVSIGRQIRLNVETQFERRLSSEHIVMLLEIYRPMAK